MRHTLFSVFILLAIGAVVAVPGTALADLLMPVVDSKEVENQVALAFPDAPVMVQIAKCESGLRQFDKNFMPLRGGIGGGMIGVFQINEAVHAAKAKSLGLDIYTLEGNISYARRLYAASGTNPWAPCVPAAALTPQVSVPVTPQVAAPAVVPAAENTTAPSPASSAISGRVFGTLTLNLTIGQVSSEVTTLQKILNAKGFIIAASGPGSPGNETAKFGVLTREALRKFQCSQGIACSGSEQTTGFGRVGPLTRAALLK